MKANEYLCPLLLQETISYFPAQSAVNMSSFLLDFGVKIGYYAGMFLGIAHFVLRLALVVTIWAFIWRSMKPSTQLMRILRAALLVLSMLGALAVMRITFG